MSAKKITGSFFRQDCYCLASFPDNVLDQKVCKHNEFGKKSYVDVVNEEVRDDTGAAVARSRYTVEEYPITPETVQSYAMSADYHVDPAACIRSAGVNLGDIRSASQMSNMDLCEVQKARAEYAEGVKRLDAYQQSLRLSNAKLKKEEKDNE